MANDDLKFAETRHKFEHNGRTVYEWSQTIDEVNIYITPPPGITAQALACELTPTKLTLGLKGNPPFIDEEFYTTVKGDETFWTLEDGEIHIQCGKITQGDTWPCALKGHTQINALEAEASQKSIMLQRFQREHAGFDFSGAQFNGQAPDASTFMGGMSPQ